jgi:hypothetical protein
METQDQVVSWLLEDDQPAVRYFTLLDLLGKPADYSDVREAYSNIPRKGWALDIFRRQRPRGYWETEKDLYRPKYTATNWMALVLSDFGLTKEIKQIRETADLFFRKWMREQEPNIFHDEVCIVGNTARMLTRFGYEDDPKVRRLFDRLVEDQRENGGWHCRESANGTLDGWEALAAFAALPRSKWTRRIKNSVERGAEFYLKRKLFDDGKPKYRPWFRLHYPVHYYYDILVGLDVITKLGYGGDNRLEPALRILRNKRQRNGIWLLESIHPDPASYSWGKGNLRRKVKPFGLEEAGEPSKWITLSALRVLKRVDAMS